MADFEAVLRKTIGGLAANTPEVRRKVYDKARATIEAKLAAIVPPPPAAVVDRQRKALEDAIVAVEASYATQSEDDDLDAIFASLRLPSGSDDKARPLEAAPPLSGPESETLPREEVDLPAVPSVDHAAVNGPESDPVSAGDDDRFSASPAPVRTTPSTGPRQRSGRWGLVTAVILVLALCGGGYALWLNQDALGDFFAGMREESEQEPAPTPSIVLSGDEEGTDGPEESALDEEAGPPVDAPPPQAAEETDETDQDIAAVEPAEPDEQPEPAGSSRENAAEDPEKFTQRLLEDGTEVDMGPAEQSGGIGEGTSVAATVLAQDQPAAAEQSEPGSEGVQEGNRAGDPPADEPAAAEPAVAVGQRAIFYEERTSSAQGSAETGSIVWSLVQESPGGDAPPEPAIRAEASVPDKDIQLRMTIRRNVDQTLPASHIVEMIFLTPDDFSGGGIENVLRMTLKRSEEAPGAPLLGIPAKIAEGFFLIALSDAEADTSQNLNLLEREQWIDIPMVYRSGRRALITLEKGIPGGRVFEQALEAWRSGSSG